MRDSFENFDRNFRIMQRVVFGFIAFVFVSILCFWGATAYFAVHLGPEGAGRMLGQVVNGYNQTVGSP